MVGKYSRQSLGIDPNGLNLIEFGRISMEIDGNLMEIDWDKIRIRGIEGGVASYVARH